jgi:spermidine synthase
MLNTEPAQRHAFLEACRRHVYPQGVVVIQQTAPSWFDTARRPKLSTTGSGGSSDRSTGTGRGWTS